MTHDPQRHAFAQQSEDLRGEVQAALREIFDRTDMPTSEDVELHLAAMFSVLMFEAAIYFCVLDRPRKLFLDLAKTSYTGARKEFLERKTELDEEDENGRRT